MRLDWMRKGEGGAVDHREAVMVLPGILTALVQVSAVCELANVIVPMSHVIVCVRVMSITCM